MTWTALLCSDAVLQITDLKICFGVPPTGTRLPACAVWQVYKDLLKSTEKLVKKSADMSMEMGEFKVAFRSVQVISLNIAQKVPLKEWGQVSSGDLSERRPKSSVEGAGHTPPGLSCNLTPFCLVSASFPTATRNWSSYQSNLTSAPLTPPLTPPLTTTDHLYLSALE